MKELLIFSVLLCWPGAEKCETIDSISNKADNTYIWTVTEWKKIEEKTNYSVNEESKKENIRIRY